MPLDCLKKPLVCGDIFSVEVASAGGLLCLAQQALIVNKTCVLRRRLHVTLAKGAGSMQTYVMHIFAVIAHLTAGPCMSCTPLAAHLCLDCSSTSTDLQNKAEGIS